MKHAGYAGDGVDVYPVGLLHDLRLVWGALRRAPTRTGWAFGKLQREVRRSWRRRSYWNGFLAEPTVDAAQEQELAAFRVWRNANRPEGP